MASGGPGDRHRLARARITVAEDGCGDALARPAVDRVDRGDLSVGDGEAHHGGGPSALKQGASFGHAKIAGKTILRRGLSPLAVTISTATAAPVLAGVRLRAGRAGSAKGAASMVTEAISTATDAGAQAANILARGDSAFCSGKVVAAVVKTGATFSFTIAGNPAVDAAIGSIPDEQDTPVHYPGAVTDPDTGELISDAQVAEVEYTAFARHPLRDHRPAHRAPRPGRQHPRPAVPGLALPPVVHHQHRAGHRSRHHPPPPRHLRDRLVRPHRRTLPCSRPAISRAQQAAESTTITRSSAR
jgi:hypothetical protein